MDFHVLRKFLIVRCKLEILKILNVKNVKILINYKIMSVLRAQSLTVRYMMLKDA